MTYCGACSAIAESLSGLRSDSIVKRSNWIMDFADDHTHKRLNRTQKMSIMRA